MTCLQIEELLEAYALAALEPEEQASVERHLNECPSCQKRVDEYWETVGLFPSSAQLVPAMKAPSSLKASVWAKIGVRREDSIKNRWFDWLKSPVWAPVLTAASVLLVLAFSWLHVSRVHQLEQMIEITLSPVKEARFCPVGTRLLGPAPEAPSGPHGHPPWGCIYQSFEPDSLMILVADVPPMPPNSEVHLWFKRGEECLDGGVVSLQKTDWGWMTVRSPLEYDTVLVTQESKGSRTKCPQGSALMVASF
jgi:hypothetical protein